MSNEQGQFFLDHVQPKVSTGGVVALSRVEEKRGGVFLLLPIEGEVGRDGHTLGAEAQGALGDGV